MSVLEPWGGLKIIFERRHISALFTRPQPVLSSCRVFGGLRDDLECVCNHQICEPVGHTGQCAEEACSDPAAYLERVRGRFGLPGRTALLATAANMQCAGRALEEFGRYKALALITAGVDGNAARAGDPASYAETGGVAVPLPPGTINIMLFFNSALAQGAMLEAAMLATEAKSSVLQELSVPSLYSSGLATGTGTDGLALSAPSAVHWPGPPLTGAGKHSKLGEMIGRAVRAALCEALARQNSLLPAMRCNVLKLLGRFGLSEALLLENAEETLTPENAALLASNLIGICTDPPAAAAAAALAHICDQTAWGVIPQGAAEDLLLDYAAIMAARVGGRAERQPACRAELAACRERAPQKWSAARAAAMAVVIGFRDKWRD